MIIAGEATRLALQRAADTEIVHDDTKSRTGAQLDRAIDLVARDLTSQVKPGGAVGIWCWNSVEAIVAHLAAERAGLTRVPVDPASPVAEAEAIYSASSVGCVMVDNEHHLPTVRTMKLDDGLWYGGTVRFEPIPVEDDMPATTIVRGVTGTGLFAIPISFANWEAHMRLSERLFRSGRYGTFPEQPRFLTVQQMMYGTGLIGTFPFLRMGLPQTILTKFDPAMVVDRASEFGATSTFMVPGMITRLVKALGPRPPERWHLRILYGGAPFPLGDLRSAVGLLGPTLTQLYGRFEGGWPITVLSEADHDRIVMGDDALASSCGRAVEGIELDLRDLGAGQRELRVRSECVSPALRDPDGWCALGDVASRDEDGYYFLHGRVDGMINTGSFHVYPDEVVGAILETFPTVRTVQVVGERDAKWGEAVCADIEWEPGTHPPEDSEFRSRLAGRIAKYKVPTVLRHTVT